MVTASKKPKAAPKKAAAKPKAPAKKATVSRAKPKTTVVKAKTAKKTSAPAKAVEAAESGEMVYNDELFESLSEAILLGDGVAASLLPEIKKELFDYDIYMVSFLDDGDIDEIAGGVSKADAAALKPLLTAIRDNARVFVDIASGYNSVRSFIDRSLKSEGKDKLKLSFIEGEYCLKGTGPETCESFLMLF